MCVQECAGGRDVFSRASGWRMSVWEICECVGVHASVGGKERVGMVERESGCEDMRV